MIRKSVWCFFIFFFISGNRCSPSDRDLHAFSTVLDAAQTNSDGKSLDSQVQDSETAATNSYSDEDEDDSREDPPGPEDHVIPYTEHEDPGEVPTRPKYEAPGVWAKPDPKKNIPLDFVPTKSLAQVRGTHTIKVLPQSDAIATATTDEERENAPRLRKVVSNKKTNTIYTEEGYEDSAYDHAGHVRDADFHEGFARKLHDQRASKARSGAKNKRRKPKKKKQRSQNLERAPQEFDEFTDDYSDEHAHSEKLETDESSKRNEVNRINKDAWKRPDINPKYVTENEVEKLENDLRREAEEAEKGSEINAVPDLHQDDHEETSSASEGERSRISEYSPSTRAENLYTENYDATTTQFETPTPGNSENYETSTPGRQDAYYRPEGSALQGNYETTTFTQGNPNDPQPVLSDAPTTMNYGQLFWNYYQSNPYDNTSPGSYVQEQTTIQQPVQVRETTLGPYVEENPSTLAAVNGHGGPDQFGFERFSYYPTVQNGHQYLNPNAIANDNRRTNDQENSDSGQRFNNFIESNRPAFDFWGLYKEQAQAAQSPFLSADPYSAGFYDDFTFSMAPDHSVINSTPNKRPKRPQKNANQNRRHRDRYQGRPSNNRYPQAPERPRSNSRIDQDEGPSSLRPKSHGKTEMSFFGYAPNLSYTKMLDYIKSQEYNKYNGQKSESANLEDFTIMKPPAFGESVFSDFTLNSYPNVVDYSSETQESEAVQKTNKNNPDSSTNSTKHNGSSQSDIHSDSPVFYGGRSPASINHKQTYPASRLLPPAPNSNNHYVRNHKRMSPPLYHNHEHGAQNFRPNLPQLPNHGSPPRYVRSSDDEALTEVGIADVVIAQEINARFNSTSGIPQDQKSRPERDATHQDLLDASHKTAGDVIDGEITSRFRDNDHDAVEVDDDEGDEEEDEETKREKIVEVDVPDLDYIDEIQDVNEITIPSTTPAGVDLQKYPFYENTKVPNYSPLKYIVNPKIVPKKTLGGMEFYDSRDRYIRCDELGPNLDGVLPDEEEPVPNRGPKQNLPRLRGLGDKLDCFKAKFFGENPFDNPIFFEKKITQPTPPSELDPVKFALQISELPKENKDQIIPAQSRKPESMPIKRIDDNRSANSQQVAVAEIRNKRRKNANYSTVRQSSTEKPERTTRSSRRHRPARRLNPTTTESPEVRSVTPYEKEVYEDVMGTIKNLASLYEIYGAPNDPPTSEAPRTGQILSAASIRNVKTVNRGPSSSGKTESPSHEEIEGLLPPPEPNKKPRIGPYRTDKVSYNTRVRTESPLRNGDKKIVGFFRTVRVHKRSVDGDGTTSSTTERPKRRRKTSLSTTVAPVAIDATGTETKTPKPYYTIRNRSKNSKDVKSTSRHGLFTTTEQPSTTTDRRRNEPRYTEIMRRRGQVARITTTTPSSQLLLDNTKAPTVEHVTESGEIYESGNSVPRKRKVSAENTEESEFEEENDEASDKPLRKTRKYDVREDVQEGTTASTIEFPRPTKSSEFTTYPFTDPPATSAALEDEPNPKFRNWNSEGAEDEKENYEDEESKEEQVEEEEEAPPKASYIEDDSDEDGIEAPKSSERYSTRDSADESEEQKKNDDDDMTFFRYESRPESPFESFEDEKYAELGPRINKPAFEHPAFEAPKWERSYFTDGQEDDKDKADNSFESEKYVFPWVQDEEDEKLEAKEGYVEEATERYEYPWEKRERLAEERKERRERRKNMESLLGYTPFSHEDFYGDEKEGSSSETNGKQVYAWDRYDVPSKKYKKKFWTKAELDSDETSSEHRPVTKFSSKYSSSKFRLPFNGKAPITTVEPKKIRDSVLKYLKEADEASTEPTEDDEPDSFTTTRPEPLSTTTAHAELTHHTNEPTPAGSKSNKRISNSRIIPEDITTTPRQKVKKVVHVRERTTLRPSVRSTTEAVKVEKAPIQRTVFRPYVRTTTETAKVEKSTIRSIPRTTEAPVEAGKDETTTASVTTRRRPSRLRGYKAQESQTVANTVLATPTLTTTSTSTTEKPVETSTRTPGRFGVRKRGKAKTVSSTEKNIVKNRQKVGVVTGKSTETTTAKSRRTRPTIATRLATVKKRPVNDEIPKKSSHAGAKSASNSGDRNIEDSSPTSRTVEHRSRVSTEEIITKTSFPKQDRKYKAYKDTVDRVTPNGENFDDVPFANSGSKKSYSKIPNRGRSTFGETKSEDEYPDENESVERTSITTKETPEHVYEKKEILDKDGNKGMFISITPKNRTIEPLELEDELNLKGTKFEDEPNLKKTKLEDLKDGKDQNYNNKFDEHETQNAASNGDVGSESQVDGSMIGHLLDEVPPRSDQSEESEESDESEKSEEASTEGYTSSEEYSSEEREDRPSDEIEGSNESAEDDDSEDESPVVNYVKDPSQRLYHYVDLKK